MKSTFNNKHLILSPMGGGANPDSSSTPQVQNPIIHPLLTSDNSSTQSLSPRIKRFSSLVSVALCALSLPFSNQVLAAPTNLGQSGCSTSSSSACIGINYDNNGVASVKMTYSDTLDTTSDEKSITATGFYNPAYKIIMFNANKSIAQMNSGITIGNGSTINADFKDSAWKGNFTNTGGGFSNPSSFSFNGNYQGNSDASVKGYAYVGNISETVGQTTFNFNNQANMKGNVNISPANPNTDAHFLSLNYNNSNLTGSMTNNGNKLKASFKNSKMVGNITTANNADVWILALDTTLDFKNSTLDGNISNTPYRFQTVLRSRNETKVTFDGNKDGTDYAMKGNITNELGLMDVTFNNTKMKGNITTNSTSDSASEQAATVNRQPIETKLTFKNSELDGNITQSVPLFFGYGKVNSVNTDVTFSGNGTNGYAMKDHSINLHNTGGVGGKGNISLDKGAKLEN
ncbi:hypothetical protein, partial [Helicobacter sp. 11S03491-1]|uniref:hypothetical protein n=1 Tax=Helicobacter sp. 11S03491-1 TaxID=1476196 RepID=UPI00117B43B7